MIDREERFLNIRLQDIVAKTPCFLILLAVIVNFCALLYILCMLWVFIVTCVIVTGF